MANQFWFRWRREFLQNLQSRCKWMQPRRNIAVGDIVISKEDNGPRNQWLLVKVIDVYPSQDGCVRKVKILKADGELDNQGRHQKPPTTLQRPIHKLVLLLPCDESRWFPLRTVQWPGNSPSRSQMLNETVQENNISECYPCLVYKWLLKNFVKV